MIHNEHIEYFYNDFCQQKILVYINHSIQYKECTFQQTYHVLHPLKFLKLENRGYKSSLQKKKKKIGRESMNLFHITENSTSAFFY